MDLVTLVEKVMKVSDSKMKPQEALGYLSFFALSMTVWKLLSDGTFSNLIVLSAGFQALGLYMVLAKVNMEQSVAGLSSRTIQMYLVAYMFRLSSTLVYNGYLPVDRTGDWIYQTTEISAFVMCFVLLSKIHGKFVGSYQKDADNCQMLSLLAACVILAYFVHPNLNRRKIPDMCWTSAMYIESVVLVPQLFMMAKKGGRIDMTIGHFIFCVCTARSIMFYFWVNTYDELAPKDGGFNYAGYGVLGAHLLQLLLCADFLYYYMKSVVSGGKAVVLPVIEV